MADLTVTQGDNKPDVLGVLTDRDTGDPIDLTDCDVVFRMRKSDDRLWTVNAAATVTDAPNGRVRYSWGANDLANHGEYEAYWRITFLDTTTQSTEPPNTIEVRRR
jgi:hypothetical protein